MPAANTSLNGPEAELGFAIPPLDDMQDLVRMRFLHDVVLEHADPTAGGVLEIGCFKGCSTIFLAEACLKRGFGGLTTIDLFTGTPSWGVAIDTYEEATRRFAERDLGSFVKAVRADSRSFTWSGPLAVLHVDGDHAYEAVSSDLARFTPLLAPGGIVVVDDYDSGHEGVVRAVHELLVRDSGLSVLAANDHRRYYGSIALRRRPVW